MWIPRSLRSPFPQEYLCLAHDACEDLWRMELDGEDVTHTHVFLGYRPLVVGFPAEVAGDRERVALSLRSPAGNASPVATIGLRRIMLNGLGSKAVFYTGERARSRFLPWHQWAPDRVRRWRNARREGNVARPGKEVDMTRIMYAWPREIHLAVVGSPGCCNIFPTDLHGMDEPDHYLISLRHSGLASAQVVEEGTLSLFRMPLDHHREVYALGHRHMKLMEAAAAITPIDGEWNGGPRPLGALSASRLHIEAHADHGIHRIFRCRIDKEEHFRSASALAHVHASPLTWLKRKGTEPRTELR